MKILKLSLISLISSIRPWISTPQCPSQEKTETAAPSQASSVPATKSSSPPSISVPQATSQQSHDDSFSTLVWKTITLGLCIMFFLGGAPLWVNAFNYFHQGNGPCKWAVLFWQSCERRTEKPTLWVYASRVEEWFFFFRGSTPQSAPFFNAVNYFRHGNGPCKRNVLFD